MTQKTNIISKHYTASSNSCTKINTSTRYYAYKIKTDNYPINNSHHIKLQCYYARCMFSGFKKAQASKVVMFNWPTQRRPYGMATMYTPKWRPDLCLSSGRVKLEHTWFVFDSIILGSTGRVDSLILIFVDSLVPHSCRVMVCNVPGFFPFWPLEWLPLRLSFSLLFLMFLSLLFLEETYMMKWKVVYLFFIVHRILSFCCLIALSHFQFCLFSDIDIMYI